MEFQIYDASANCLSNFFSTNTTKPTYPSYHNNNSNSNYSLALDIMENDEYFNWNVTESKVNSLTMLQQHPSSNSHQITNRKRKLLTNCSSNDGEQSPSQSPDGSVTSVIVDDDSSDNNSGDSCLTTDGHDTVIKPPPAKAIMLKANHDQSAKMTMMMQLHKKEHLVTNGGSRMPQWQVEDISELNGDDIDGSLNVQHAAAHPTFNMNDAILSISGLTVFKQEAPSPTSTTNNSNNGGGGGNHCQDGGRHLVPIQLVHGASSQYGRPNNTDNNNNNNNAIYSNGQEQLQLHGYSNGQRSHPHPPNGHDGNGSNGINIGSTSNSQNQNPNQVNQVQVQLSVPLQMQPDSYSSISSTNSVAEDGASRERQFQYILAAATSIATKLNEDTLTYLNQGQSYEIKLKSLSSLATLSPAHCRGKTLHSVIRVCFHERRLQYMEREQMLNWQRARPGDRILEMDVPLSYGLTDVIQSTNNLNLIQFNWDPSKDTGAYIKVNCISTEFTPKKHGGEKGVPFRIQVATYVNTGQQQQQQQPVLLHAAACQVKVFKLKGADRKHKQDRDKVLKRPPIEQDKFQPSYDYTVLNEISSDAVVSFAVNDPIDPLVCESYARNCGQAAINAAPIVPKPRAESKSPSPLSPSKLDSNSGEKNLEAVVINGTKGVTAEHVDNINSPVLQQQQQQLTTNTDPSEASRWLLANRFESHLVGFSSFSGADLLRMSREDLMQVCGPPDGIRLYNTLHQNRWMEPALTVYVARSRAAAYHAIYLRSLSTNELQAKLSTYLSLCADSERISAIYMQGPQGIHVHLDDSLLRCIKHESIFSVAILHSNAGNAGNAHNADNTNIGKNVVNVAILLKPEFNVANDHVNNVNVNVKGMSHSH